MKVYWAPTICGQREVGPRATVSALSCAGSVGVCARPIPGSVARVPVVTSIANLSARRRAGRELAFFTVGQQQMQPSRYRANMTKLFPMDTIPHYCMYCRALKIAVCAGRPANVSLLYAGIIFEIQHLE